MRAEKPDSLILPRSTTMLVLLPILVTVVGFLLNGWLAWQEPPPTGPLTSGADSRYEAIGRSRVLAAFLPFMLVSILIVLNFARECRFFFGPRLRRNLRVPLILFLAMALVIGVAQLKGGLPSPAFDLVKSALGRVPTDPGIAQSGQAAWHQTLDAVTVLEWLFGAFIVLLISGSASVTVGTISCLARPDPSLTPSVKRYYRDAQRERLTTWLYASSLLLVTGLFFIDSCLRWPAAFSANRDLYTAHVNALMFQNGILYSTIMASYYVPVAWLMRPTPGSPGVARPRSSAGTEIDPRPSTLFSPLRVIKATAAILSPAIAGVLAQLIEGLQR